MPGIPALRRLSKEDGEFAASLRYTGNRFVSKCLLRLDWRWGERWGEDPTEAPHSFPSECHIIYIQINPSLVLFHYDKQ